MSCDYGCVRLPTCVDWCHVTRPVNDLQVMYGTLSEQVPVTRVDVCVGLYEGGCYLGLYVYVYLGPKSKYL